MALSSTRHRAKTSKDVDDFKDVNTLDDWADRWEFKSPGWQLEHPNPSLVKHYDALVKGLAAEDRGSSKLSSPRSPRGLFGSTLRSVTQTSRCRIFVPLCGKTRDLKWLHDRGNLDVVGVEWCRDIVLQLFKEAGFGEVREIRPAAISNGSVPPRIFEIPDGSFRILQGDFFGCTVDGLGGKVDAIWDRDAFSAVNVEDRSRYANQLHRLLKRGGTILMDTPLYNAEEYRGDPHPVTDDDLVKHFGSGNDSMDGRDDESASRLEGSTVNGIEGNGGNGCEGIWGNGPDVGRFKIELLEVVDVEETWPAEYGISSYVKRIHTLRKS